MLLSLARLIKPWYKCKREEQRVMKLGCLWVSKTEWESCERVKNEGGRSDEGAKVWFRHVSRLVLISAAPSSHSWSSCPAVIRPFSRTNTHTLLGCRRLISHLLRLVLWSTVGGSAVPQTHHPKHKYCRGTWIQGYLPLSLIDLLHEMYVL